MSTVTLRRFRKNKAIRDSVSQTKFSVKDLILPYFVIAGKNRKEEIKSMPEAYHLSIDNLLGDIEHIKKIGIKAILLFGVTQKKDIYGSQAYSKQGIVQKAARAIKEQIQDITVMTDVCLCGYTSHGHCGIVNGKKIDNDATIKVLAKIALSHAKAGADFVAPSAMMDGQVKAIRETLDENRFKGVRILAYSAKYASNFYGPFRDALNSAPQFGDRKSYQMDFRNSDEALREIAEDIKEGADIVMVKPALSYLDIIYRVKQKFNIPIAAYSVSGEYSLIQYGIEHGLADKKELVLEILNSIKRAGADLIITYWAKDVAKWLS